MAKRFGRWFGLLIPASAVVVLAVLLVFALVHLAQIQRDMRSNVSANMLWVITQTQVKTLHLMSILQQHRHEGGQALPLAHTYNLLRSRLELMQAGPQRRYLEALGESASLMTAMRNVHRLSDDFHQVIAGDEVQVEDTLQLLAQLDRFLNDAANLTMMAQWDEMGGRLDRYRDGVLRVIFLMLGIWASGLVITIYLIIAMKRLREADQLKLRALTLQAQLDAARQLAEWHRNFATMMSHQFRTPLAIIDASMQRLLRSEGRLDAAQTAQRAQKARDAVLRLTHLLERALLVEDSDGITDFQVQAVSLPSLLEEIVADHRQVYPDRDIRLTIDGEALPAVACDPALLEHIIGNLIVNAIRYSPDGTPVQVTVFPQGEQVACSVRDWGQGIDPVDLPNLFDKYFRGESVANTQGTGIGLYLARRLTQLQGGRLTVEAAHPGSVFTAHFNVARAQEKDND